MSKIMFFSIPAHGHTNPTIAVVSELVKRGHRVRYFSFEEFREKIENTGAEFISCDAYLPPAPEDLDRKLGKDFASMVEMLADTTVSMDEMMRKEMEAFLPDCIVSDSVCFWGKLFAQKYGVPFVCSTTTFAFNQHTAKLMKQGMREIFYMIKGMPRINEKLKLLREHGYPVKDLVSIIQNDNDTNTIVYTSRMFQPMADTFSEKYAFIGPSLAKRTLPRGKKEKPQVYISLGTVLNDNIAFYRRCMEALSDVECSVVISAGRNTDLSKLGKLPPSFSVFPYVDQLAVLAQTDVFLTHCGMNSVNESLYCGVPMVLYPQHSEETAVANRVEELGAGVFLKRAAAKDIRKAVVQVLENERYRKNAELICRDFHRCGGAYEGADLIERVSRKSQDSRP